MAWKVKFEEKPETQYPPVSERPRKVEYPLPGNKVEVYVDKVYGCCPTSVEGDKLTFNISMLLDQCKISSELPMYGGLAAGSKPRICSIAFNSIYPYMVAMSLGVDTVDLGITKSGKDGFVMCPAWGPPTCEALVIFRLHSEPIDKCATDAWYESLAKLGWTSVPSYFLERFATEETKEARKKKIEEWKKAGKPIFWEGWRHPQCQPRHEKEADR
jgi:uncharacterized repeat protein (TIGR04076 family)